MQTSIKKKNLTIVFSATLGVLICQQGAQAQQSNDPFSPNAVAPTLPQSVPTAPQPTAPYIAPKAQPLNSTYTPPRAMPKASVSSQPLDNALNQPSSASAAPSVAVPPVQTTNVTKTASGTDTPPTQNAPSFWDKLTSIFDTDAEGSTNNTPISKETRPAARPSTPSVDTASPASEQLSVNVLPAEVYTQSQMRSDNSNPFALNNVAPTTPPQVAPAAPAPALVNTVNTPTTTPTVTSTPTTVTTTTASTEATAAETEQTSFLDRVSDFFTPTSSDAPTSAPAATTATEMDATEETIENPITAFGNLIGNLFSGDAENSKKIEIDTPPAPQPPVQEPVEETEPENNPLEVTITPLDQLDPRLVKARFGIGRDIRLGQSDNDLSKQAKCFTKLHGTVVFCSDPTSWPSNISKYFDVTTYLYQGTKGLIQFENAKATRTLALFQSDGFDDIVQILEKNLGPSTSHFERTIHSVLKGKIANRVHIWRKPSEDGKEIETLEIRQYSDLQAATPDLEHGVYRVYYNSAPELFKRTSTLDFLDIK